MLHLATNIFEMTSPTSITEMAFILHDLVKIQVSCLSTNVYSKAKVVPGMPNFELAHAFQVIKSALDLLLITTCLILDAIGLQLNCSAIVKGLMFDWKSAFDTHWFDFANLAILSFHNLVGMIITNTMAAGNLSILLPIVNGPIATCRHQSVCIVCVNCMVNFAVLISVRNYGRSILRVGFYVKLPQTTWVMVKGNHADYSLTTLLSTGNLGMLTPAQEHV
jgi:hypothetical protein